MKIPSSPQQAAVSIQAGSPSSPGSELSGASALTSAVALPEPDAFIGIDYHKRYSVYHVLDPKGKDLAKGRIDHVTPAAFLELVRRYQRPRVVFEATMNWHWLLEVLEKALPIADIVLANPHKTRVIAEAQVKTDKVDARILANLLRVDMLCTVHIPCQANRERKEVLRQRCFFVKQRTMLRNRIHRLLGAQHGLVLPVVSDLFGKAGWKWMEELTLPAPAGLMLKQQLEMLRNLSIRIKEDEIALAELMSTSPELAYVASLPGMGPTLAAVVVTEIDDICRFTSAQKLTGYAGLCPSTSSSGGKTYHGKLLFHCNKWLRWAFVEAAWVAVGCDPYFKKFYKHKKSLGKKSNVALVSVARRMCRITWQLLTQQRKYAKDKAPEKLQDRPARGASTPAGLVKEVDGILAITPAVQTERSSSSSSSSSSPITPPRKQRARVVKVP
jgi:transposase